MIDDSYYAKLCAETYSPTVQWAFAGAAFHATLTYETDGTLTIACEGSHSDTDWEADFTIFDEDSFDHPDLGPVHAGFNRTTDECLDQIISTINARPVRLTGHSKGGAEAEMLSAKLRLHGVLVESLVTFGTPRWVIIGNKKPDALIPAAWGTSYRHFKDIVTEVPPELYQHPTTRPVVEVGTGTWRDLLNPRGMHDINAYVEDVP